jgi:hypothetical protein
MPYEQDILKKMEYSMEQIDMKIAKLFVNKHHYAKNNPPINKIALGLFRNSELVGIATWGFGVRPRHTIEKWFKGLGTDEYLELNRLCVLDSEPRNTESYFLSLIYTWFKNNHKNIKVLISWADGLRGKAGYVYQGSSWNYIGKIKSEFYINKEMEVIHPRFLITKYGSRGIETINMLKLSKVRGYQFFFYKPLVKLKKFASHTVFPILPYPKEKDIQFWINSYQPNEWKESGLIKVKGKINSKNSQIVNLNATLF